MPAADAVLLPLCIGLTLVGLVVTGFAFRRGRRGRAVQGLALALAPVALYFTGLLRLLWNAVVAVVGWATGSVFDLAAWVGFGVLALCLVLWVAGGIVARRTPKEKKKKEAVESAPAGSRPQVVARRQPAKQPVEQDDDMAEIDALLKSRGIQ